jgi:hypothetical protein
MRTVGNIMVLEEAAGFSPNTEGVDYTDISGARVHIPIKLLVRLYEGTKFTFEKRGIDWDAFCASLFKEVK